MTTKSDIKFYILFVYLVIVKFPLACEERLTSSLVIVNHSKEIIGCVNYRFPEIYLTFKNVENPNENCVLTQTSARITSCNCMKNTLVRQQSQMFKENLWCDLILHCSNGFHQISIQKQVFLKMKGLGGESKEANFQSQFLAISFSERNIFIILQELVQMKNILTHFKKETLIVHIMFQVQYLSHYYRWVRQVLIVAECTTEQI